MAALAQLNVAVNEGLRKGILAAADSSRVQHVVRRYGMRLGASRFVAGETLDECVAVLRRLQSARRNPIPPAAGKTGREGP